MSSPYPLTPKREEGTHEMKLEEGKYYVTRSGERVRASYDDNGIMKLSNGSHVLTATGRGNRHGGLDTENDIISEWATGTKEGPIREVRRREIVPGQWGNINISHVQDGTIFINVRDDFGHVSFDAEQLREAAHLFNQLAEYLEGEK